MPATTLPAPSPLTVTLPAPRVSLVRVSKNGKTGPIPVSTTEQSSCPDRCPFLGDCYASHGRTPLHWRNVPVKGATWADFCDQIATLPRGQVWRHNEAGDLPRGAGEDVHVEALHELVQANRGRKGYTYTHHEMTPVNVTAFKEANAGGFTINVSCETPAQVDLARAAGLPAVLTIPKGESIPKGATTPAGHPIRQCPAERVDAMTCARCGICARADRDTVIAFTAHGSGARKVGAAIERVRLEEATQGVTR
jgi:hypothetical protein